MRRIGRRQVLAAILGTGIVILVIIPVLLGIAIRQRTIAPPQLDIRLGALRLLAYATHPIDCDRYVTPCVPKILAPPAQECYVIWVLTRTGQRAPTDDWQTGIRLLILPLRNQFMRP